MIHRQFVTQDDTAMAFVCKLLADKILRIKPRTASIDYK